MSQNTSANWRSPLPMPGLSKRAQELLKPKTIGAYSKAHPSQPKREH